MSRHEKNNPTPAEPQIRHLQDQFADLSDELTLLCETVADVLLGQQELSDKSKSGLANFAFALHDRVQVFEKQLNLVHLSHLERFDRLVQQCPTMLNYYDPEKKMMKIREIWRDFESMSRDQQFLIQFMVMVWNPPLHRFPSITTHQILLEAQHLKPEDRKLIFDWMNDPFLVMNKKGNLEN